MAKKEEIIGGITKTVNEGLLNGAIRHAVDLERFKNGIVKKVISFLEKKVIPDLSRQIDTALAEIEDAKKLTQKLARLSRLKKAIEEITKTKMEITDSIVRDSLKNLATTEAEWQVMAIKNSTQKIPLAVNYVMPSKTVLKSMVETSMFEGDVLGEWFSELGSRTAKKIEREIRMGIVQGESIPKMRNRLIGQGRLPANIKQSAEAIVRTCTNNVVSQAREETFRANEELIKGVQWVSTLDARTTPTCQALDGKIFDIGDGPRPPAHWNCRSSVVPVLKSWKELGINLKEAPEGTRASMDGQVAEGTSYGDWLKGQDPETQDEILGPTRAELFRSGKVSIDRFVGSDYKPLSLAEIARREGLTMADLGN